jgi:hypothetical protein
MLDFRATADGGYLAISENQSIVITARNTGSAEEPNIKYTENFFFDDLIVYKLDATGNLSWVKRLPKNQQSLIGGVKFLSTVHGVTNSTAYLYFNDTQRNYNSNGTFKSEQFPFPVQFFNSSNVIAAIEIDLRNGDFVRKALPGLRENRVVLAPHLCEFNYASNEMIFYGQSNRRHRFGHAKLR